MNNFLYRAFNNETNKYVFGYLVKRDNDYFIIDKGVEILIDINDLSIYFGLHDKYYTKVFTNDMVYNSITNELSRIKYDESQMRFVGYSPRDFKTNYQPKVDTNTDSNIEIVLEYKVKE